MYRNFYLVVYRYKGRKVVQNVLMIKLHENNNNSMSVVSYFLNFITIQMQGSNSIVQTVKLLENNNNALVQKVVQNVLMIKLHKNNNNSMSVVLYFLSLLTMQVQECNSILLPIKLKNNDNVFVVSHFYLIECSSKRTA